LNRPDFLFGNRVISSWVGMGKLAGCLILRA
jgi:hypothetical protein